MKKTFAFIVLVVLMFSPGNRALAQSGSGNSWTTTIEVKEAIDFTGWNWANSGAPNANVTWDGNSISSISGTNGSTLNRMYTNLNYSFFVGTSSQSSEPTSTTIYSGTVVFNTWDSSLNFTINNSQFANAKVGDIIRVNYTDKVTSGGENNYNPIFKYVQSWDDFNALQNVKEEGDNYFQAAINSEALTELQARGLRLQGRGFTLTSVELISTPSDPGNTWQLWKSDTHNETYLQKYSSSNDYFNITNLQAGDEVTIWGDNGNSGNNGDNAGCRVTSGNTDRGDIAFSTSNHNEGQVIKMQSDGTLQLEFFAQWSGIRKIEIKRNVDQTNIFDYDPGYEEYDMYDEFSWEKNSNPATTYNLTGSAGFLLNGADAKYITLSGSKITTNNRIALTGDANEWTFDFGLVPPGYNGGYSYFSICNLREGDRVVISYINESENPLIFASGENNGVYYYDGCAAFKDDNRNGVLNEGEEYISNGDPASVEWHRGEGNVGNTDRGWGSGYAPELYYINSYVIAQDGHLDLAFRRFVKNDDASGDHQDSNKSVSRIVKIKIYSDHQAMMVDDYDNGIYTAHFNITGHLQAKEHIMPGGLEIHVGNDDNQHIDQHAIVVTSKDGPVSYVNAVDGFKLPGVSGSAQDGIQINFDLGINGTMANLPTSGTYYRFIPETDGKMRFKFEAKSMNYYRWDLPGHGTYDNTDLRDGNGNYGDWPAVNDRPNEQTVDAACPYYLVRIYEENGQKKMQVTNLGDVDNGSHYEYPNEISVTAGEEYYLFGGWNQTGLYYNSSFQTPGDPYNPTITNWNGTTNNPSYVNDTNHQYNNIEFRPMDGRTVGCGVAELLWVKFKRNDEIYPLAKWVPNNTAKVNDDADGGVPNPDTYQMEYELANIVGFTNYDNRITVKKMSGNIIACHPYIKRDTNDPTIGKLMIDGITFDGTKNPGGTILIKIGDPTKRTDPLYALTIAYSTNPKYDNENTYDQRGHIWNFYKESLNALVWDGTTANGAVPRPYGTYFQNYYDAGNQSTIENASTPDEVQKTLSKNEISILYDEVTNHGDWLFNYNLMYDQNLYDPIFTNKYDMEGDNADMIWDTEGTVFQTSANQSGIFNEYTTNGGTVQNTETTDPNRYVAILKGGKFRIPWLEKNDRVIIWMGAGKGRTNDFVSFKIKNAYDAVHNPISEDDEYIVGGSQWSFDGKQTNDYHGCYHFFATGRPNDSTKPADMVFEMTGGEMCKIYKVQIYRGDRIITNEIVGKTSDDKFLLWSRAKDPNDANDVAAKGDTYNWTLKYFGKDQKLANGTNSVNNDIVAWSGTGISTKTLTASDETDPTKDTYNTFTFEHDNNTIGTFRARGKDMEKNMKYVADYGEHNVTVALQQTMEYPYTWDLMDMTGWSGNATRFINEDAYGSLVYKARSEWFDSDEQWNASYEKSSTDLSLFGKAVGNDQGYVLRLNSQETASAYPQDNIFESAQTIENNEPYYGNQFWRDGEIVPESQGLWFHTLDQSSQYGSLRVYDDGMSVAGSHSWRYNMVVPNVPKDAAVYMRIKKARELDCEASYKFAGSDASSDLTLLPTEKDDEWIVAIKNDGETKRHLTLSLAGYQMKKLSVSKDPKKLNIRGWATESRDHVIDPELTAYLTGKDIETCVVSSVDYANQTITLQRVYSRPNTTSGENTTTPGFVMRKLANNGTGASILHNKAAQSLTATDGEIKILDNGFHLFVPDMHDYDKANDANGAKTITDNTSMLVARVTPTSSNDKILASNGDYTNYALTYKYYKLDAGGNMTGSVMEGDEAFYRIATGGATSSGNQGYLPLLTSSVNPYSSTYGTNPNNNATFTIIFEDEFEVEEGIATAIEEVQGSDMTIETDGYYTLSGTKVNRPTQSGLYIKNGKKIYVK